METRSGKTDIRGATDASLPKDAASKPRTVRVETIRDLVDSGHYDIPSIAIAERMLDHMLDAHQVKGD